MGQIAGRGNDQIIRHIVSHSVVNDSLPIHRRNRFAGAQNIAA